MVIHPCVADKFYPGDPKILQYSVTNMLAAATDKANLPIPKAIIAPHAGYIYSGPIAASTYACLTKAKKQIQRVIILAPSHQYPINGIATTYAEAYLTPLGKIAIDNKNINNVNLPCLHVIEEAFSHEHSLEVQLPFLQATLETFLLVPMLVGSATDTQVATILEKFWGGAETLIVVSSDLSHYYPYEIAKELDKKTANAIIKLDPDGFTSEQACGAIPIKGLLTLVASKNMRATLVDLRNSGDTSESKDQVVGYGAFHFK